MGGEEQRATEHQEEASAVREQEERHAGELHPAQVRNVTSVHRGFGAYHRIIELQNPRELAVC